MSIEIEREALAAGKSLSPEVTIEQHSDGQHRGDNQPAANNGHASKGNPAAESPLRYWGES